MVDAYAIGNCALRYGDERSAYNSHDHDSGTVPGEGAKFSDSQCEDAREHNGIEKTDEDDAPHGEVAGSQHGNGDKSSSTDGANAQQTLINFGLPVRIEDVDKLSEADLSERMRTLGLPVELEAPPEQELRQLL